MQHFNSFGMSTYMKTGEGECSRLKSAASQGRAVTLVLTLRCHCTGDPLVPQCGHLGNISALPVSKPIRADLGCRVASLTASVESHEAQAASACHPEQATCSADRKSTRL